MNIPEHEYGDNIKTTQPKDTMQDLPQEKLLTTEDRTNAIEAIEDKVIKDAISPKVIEKNEIQLKERITQCKNIIASLKLEINEEKLKLEKEAKEVQLESYEPPIKLNKNTNYPADKGTDFSDFNKANTYSTSVDSKLNCDENLMEYEKQLERYQNTLSMAQMEKKNAIRKQMLAKAFKLKLMEVENQCNIELLRIKQSVQCLEPLQMIVEKWKCNDTDNVYDLNNFQLIPRYPELDAVSGSDITKMTDEFENEMTISNPEFDKRE
ncbi:uncharacterized protein LOC112042873 [Bicyclus anynana]|uniref:Uncharacterized protein LOC112042873 n=1 Tax=Bicyclus anynana TaxID=110368 RepID=A0A6J1MTL9_BICAN|nr:uncharacterized protein LOC112042873 [Bicyclus anynana]